MSGPPPIPYAEIETLFVDAGNTLASMDFAWIGQELAARGIDCDAERLQRAEAAARPLVNASLDRLRSMETTEVFAFYLRTVLSRAGAFRALPEARFDSVVTELVPLLRGAGSVRLWSYVLPGVREGLETLRRDGVRLLVVSNSDGTVERSLEVQGLRPFFEAVLDSQIVGFEKPDPRIFERALAISGSDPKRTLHVGDMYSVDVLGARSAGIHACLLDPYDDWDGLDCEKVPDLVTLARKVIAPRSRAPERPSG